VGFDVETGDGSVLISTLQAIEKAVTASHVIRNRARLTLAPAAGSFLRRFVADNEETFIAQHADIVTTTAEIEGVRQSVRAALPIKSRVFDASP
jgi:hypothetical protein